MKIALLADAIAEHTRRWALGMTKRGHQVRVFTLNPSALSGYDPAEVRFLWSARGKNRLRMRVRKAPVVLRRLQRGLAELKPDVVHAHSAGGYAWLASLASPVPYIVSPWGTDLLVDAKASKANWLMTRRALRRAALIHVDAFHMVEEVRHYGIPADRIHVVPFGTDVERFHPGTEPDLRRELGDPARVVISTRTLNPVHSVRTLVEAIPAVLSRSANTKFVIAADGQERSDLEALVHHQDLAESVVFPGYLSEDDMARYLRVSDLYVSTSIHDAGLAASTAEAMSCGLPVIVTDNGDNRRWVDRDGGRLVPNHDSGAIAQAIIDILGNESFRRSAGLRNRRTIVEQNNVSSTMTMIERIYEAVRSGSPVDLDKGLVHDEGPASESGAQR